MAKAQKERCALALDNPDAPLIDLCMEYAGHVVTGQIAYRVEPTDGLFAPLHDDQARRRADKTMARILELQTSTRDGLRAKTALIPIILDDDWCGGIEEDHEKFLRSIADDVERLHRANQVAGKAVRA